MEAIISALVVGVSVLGLFRLISFLLGYYRMCVKLRQIPQLPSHWLYGNLRQVYDSKTYFNAVEQLVRDKKARIYCIWTGPIPSLGVTHPETTKQVMKEATCKALGQFDGYRYMLPWLGDGLLISSGRKWERNRKLLTPAFHFDILKGYITSMNKASSIFLNKLDAATSEGQAIDVFNYSCKLTLDVMLRCSLSYEGSDSIQDEKDVPYIQAVRRLSEIMSIRVLKPQYMFDWIFKLTAVGREHDRLVNVVHNFTGNIIRRRQEQLKKRECSTDTSQTRRHLDFLDILLTAKDAEGNGLTDQEIQDEVDTFTFEGHDTTASGIAWSTYALGKYPLFQDKVYEDVCNVLGDKTDVDFEDIARFEYLPMFLKEAFRLYPVVPGFSRKHYKPIILDGIEIPVGPRIDVNTTAIHYNEDVWKNHEVFDPERFSAHSDKVELYGYLPFSAGSRNCIGQSFALNEIKITIAKLVKRFRVSVEGLEEPIFLPDLILKSSNGVKVKLIPRK